MALDNITGTIDVWSCLSCPFYLHHSGHTKIFGLCLWNVYCSCWHCAFPDATEEHLAKLEQLLKSLKDFYSENKVIIAKAERHEALWMRFLELEKLATDPSRLMNRGGHLLIETKERQRLQTELPRVCAC